MKRLPHTSNPPDFNKELPEGPQFFSISTLAGLWNCSSETVERLVDQGDLEVAINMAPRGSKKSMIRVHRLSVVNFLNRRHGK